MANFVDFTPLRNLFRERDDLQNPTPGTHSRSGRSAQRHQTQRGTYTITMSLFYQTISLLCEGGILKALVTLPSGVELRYFRFSQPHARCT